jgi:hypothetical protein
MAWQAEILGVRADTHDDRHLLVDVRYYDDADQQITLGRWTFSYQGDVTQQSAVEDIRGKGRSFRSLYGRVTALQSAVGTTIAVQ